MKYLAQPKSVKMILAPAFADASRTFSGYFKISTGFVILTLSARNLDITMNNPQTM